MRFAAVEVKGKATKEVVVIADAEELRLLVKVAEDAAALNKRSSKLKALAKALGEAPVW